MAERRPAWPGRARTVGQSVVHCPYCHGWERACLALGVLATDEWAVHEAVHVRRFSNDVTLYTNGGSAMTDQRELLKTRDVAVRDEPLARLDGAGTSLERLVFTDGTSAACQALFCRPLMRQRSDLAARLGCRLLDDGAVEVNEYGQTTVLGVYAVGDMARRADFPFPAAQLAVAAAEGTLAAVAPCTPSLCWPLSPSPGSSGACNRPVPCLAPVRQAAPEPCPGP